MFLLGAACSWAREALVPLLSPMLQRMWDAGRALIIIMVLVSARIPEP